MIIVILRVLLPSEKLDEAIRTVRSLLGSTRVQPGCISCRFYQDTEEANVLTLVEEWESQDALDHHIRSDEYRKILAVMDMANERPEIRFHTVSDTGGMGVIEAARGQ
jgi:quinol monooxygenase YgiN